MSSIPVFTMGGEPAGEVEFSDALVEGGAGRQVLQDALVAYRANQRAGTASSKSKSEVAGSNKKPWKQKGTGRARAGYRQSPVWRGGSVAFGPRPRSYRKQMNRKASRLAFRMALREQLQGGGIQVIDEVKIEAPRTGHVAAILKSLGVTGKVLLVVDTMDMNLALASRNLADAEVVEAKDLHTYQLVRYPRILITRDGLAALEARLKKHDSSEGRS